MPSQFLEAGHWLKRSTAAASANERLASDLARERPVTGSGARRVTEASDNELPHQMTDHLFAVTKMNYWQSVTELDSRYFFCILIFENNELNRII